MATFRDIKNNPRSGKEKERPPEAYYTARFHKISYEKTFKTKEDMITVTWIVIAGQHKKLEINDIYFPGRKSLSWKFARFLDLTVALGVDEERLEVDESEGYKALVELWDDFVVEPPTTNFTVEHTEWQDKRTGETKKGYEIKYDILASESDEEIEPKKEQPKASTPAVTKSSKPAPAKATEAKVAPKKSAPKTPPPPVEDEIPSDDEVEYNEDELGDEDLVIE